MCRYRWDMAILKAFVCFLFLLGFTLKSITATDPGDKPNIIFFLVDDLGWKDIGSFGSTFYETPNIDALAARGMSFLQAYAASPVCSPTRASIMTGKNPGRMNTTDWFGAPQPDEVQDHWTRDKPLVPASYVEHLPLEEITIAEALKADGYSTFFAGKWHLGPSEKYWPENQGFDINVGGHDRGSPPGGYFEPYDNPRLDAKSEGEHLPMRLADETSRFIREHEQEPFFAYLSFYSVHNPQQAPYLLVEKYGEKQKRLALENSWGEEGARKVRLVQNDSVYAGMVESMDRAVGKVMNTVRSLGLEENTIVIFMSDNGGLSTSEGHPTSNMPLRGGKGWMYEGGIREPMIITWPGVTTPGSATREPVISMDFYPTMLEIAGISLKPDQHVDGKSLVPLLKGEQMERGPLYWHYPHYGNQGGSPSSAIRKGQYKLIEFYEDGRLELYNIAEDIGEQENLVERMPGKTEQLHQELKQWKEEVGARTPAPNPNVKND
ncbi:sulfatase [Aliifodinibius sp. S!AR15-10]|uniref:sulfatase n=1 Tax=Aliifodinibius sp. S!AR15-10 TaxID=2950437 RepID=UPI0028595B79|nr:sulfatase [Aliifodinibius sp. S!AR15-10]MDR8390367.1 sulfatase [Aliifodinibius sp. S!AR15-10]